RVRPPTIQTRPSAVAAAAAAARSSGGTGSLRQRRPSNRKAARSGSRSGPYPPTTTTRPRQDAAAAWSTDTGRSGNRDHVSERGWYASTRREFAPLARNPPTTTIRPPSGAAATSVRGSGIGLATSQAPTATAAMPAADTGFYPSQATSRIASAATDASATVTTFAIRSRRSVTAESPDDPAIAPLSGVLPTASPRRAMMYPLRLVPSRSAAWASSP